MTIDPPTGAAAADVPAADARPPLSAADVAAHFRVEPVTVRAWCRQGRFPGAERVGRDWRIPPAALAPRRPPAPRALAAPGADATPAAEPTTSGANSGDGSHAAAPDAPPPAARRRTAQHTAPPAGRATDRGFDRAALTAWRTTP